MHLSNKQYEGLSLTLGPLGYFYHYSTLTKKKGGGGSKTVPPFPVSILLITDQQIWYVYVGLLILYGYVLL